MSPSAPPAAPPALLIRHDGRDEVGEDALRALVRDVAGRPELAGAPVVGAGRGEPVPGALRGDGERQVVAVPLRAVGGEPALLDVLERRVAGVVGMRERAATTVLLVAAGSFVPEENADVHRAARLLWEGRGFAGVEAAFVSAAGPDVPSGLDRCRALGARRIVVLPFSFLPGPLAARARARADGWAAAHPEADVRFAAADAAAPELTDAIVTRYAEAVADGTCAVCGNPRPADATHDRC
ncbi:CbiX/SirB N-terminal domain-containing protein [Streptomyces sp. RFCAC02]|uniref:sirohydrochlorin chelatase n=1 Tax=Streptomyces sp. RFCAC02 TaxID=2499143 RepID=UPI001021BE28|nr:CbiX/SirB N-terminal domain-containing protein [Streptomyces sp. RFCAC02]